MTAHLAHLRGRDRLEAVTALLQRCRLTDPTAGIWEAADIQWWWRRPRRTDDLALPVWFDDDGPVAAAILTDWGDVWQADALVVPDRLELDLVWSAALDALADSAVPAAEVLARDDDAELVRLLAASGFEATSDRSGVTSMHASDRPAVVAAPEGYRIVDRSDRADEPHPMRVRNGEDVAARLLECSLYDPALDLAVETDAGEPAGYALFWLDPVTAVGLLEPMRVEDAHQRRGLARSLLTTGLERLARRGAERLKVGFDGEAGRNLYLGAGFTVEAMLRAYRR